MALMAYRCDGCGAEFSMDDQAVVDPAEICCPRCGEDGTVGSVVEEVEVDEQDEENQPPRSSRRR